MMLRFCSVSLPAGIQLLLVKSSVYSTVALPFFYLNAHFVLPYIQFPINKAKAMLKNIDA